MVARGRSREATGGVPPRVLRDYCRKTLTPQPLAESPPTLLAPPARLNSGVYNLISVLFRCETLCGFRNSCTNDRFQPRIWAIIDSRFHKPAGKRDSSYVETALRTVKSVIRVNLARYRGLSPDLTAPKSQTLRQSRRTRALILLIRLGVPYMAHRAV